jgi:hypothetical protein
MQRQVVIVHNYSVMKEETAANVNNKKLHEIMI